MIEYRKATPKDAPALKERMLSLEPRRFLKYLVGRDPETVVRRVGAAVPFKDSVYNSVLVYRPVSHRKGPSVSEVEGTVYFPVLWRLKGRDNVRPLPVLVMGRIVYKFLKESSLNACPIAVKHHSSSLFRKRLELGNVIGISLHKRSVVVDLSGNKNVVFGPLLALVYPVNE